MKEGRTEDRRLKTESHRTSVFDLLPFFSLKLFHNTLTSFFIKVVYPLVKYLPLNPVTKPDIGLLFHAFH